MIKSLRELPLKMFLVVAVIVSAGAFAQTPVALPATSPYSENFNVTPGAAGTTYPTGWIAYQGTTPDAAMLVSTASTTTGGNHNYGSCIGLLASGSYGAPLYNVLAISNTTGKTNLKISYNVKKIREQGRSQSFNLEISTTSAIAGFTAVTGGAYDSGSLAEGNVKPYTNLDISALDNISGTVWLRWAYTELGGSGSRDGVALDDVVISYDSPPLVPNAPVATAATANNTGTSFIANWNAVTGATGYRLDVATDNAFTNKLEDYDDIAVSGTTKLVNIGILPNETYYYRVRAEIDAETSANSNTISVIVSPFVLQAPVATTATLAGSAGFTANWNAVSGATGYYLDVSTSPDFGTVQENLAVETFTLMPAAASAYANRTWTGNGGIEWFATEARTDRTIPADATDRLIAIYETTTAQAELISGPVTGDFNHLRFDAWKVLSSGTTATLTASVLSGTNYETQTVIGTQQTPSNTTAKNTFAATLPATITGPYKIKIEVTENTGGTRAGIDNVTFGTRTVSAPLFVTGYQNLDVGNVTSFNVTGLDPATTYYYRVRAYTATDTSVNSNVIGTATTCVTVAPPTALPQQFCGSATVADLDLAEDNVHWYTVQTGGTELAPETALATGTYYASLFIGSCESTRVAVQVIVTNTAAPIVAPLSVCEGSTVADLTANGTDLKWYADATATTPIDSATAVTAGDYYVTQTIDTCESPRAVVTVTVLPIPVAPIAESQVFCGSATVSQLIPAPVNTAAAITESFEVGNLTGLTGAHNFASGTWNMQNGSNNGSDADAFSGKSIRFGSFHRYTSPAFNKIKVVKFYARAAGAKTLEIKKIVGTTETTLQVIPLTTTLQQYAIQVNEVNDNVKIQFLGENTNILAYVDEVQFIFNDGTPEIKWYADATGGNALAATDVLITGDYYVAQVVNGCEGPRTEVAVTINEIPDAPIATALSFCGTPTVAELTATGTGLKWYAAGTGGSELPVTDALVAGNYYVSQTINGCESQRAEVAVTINAIPDAPVATSLGFCGSATVADLTATGTALKWYADEITDTALADSEVLTTKTYYVSQTVGTCESPRASVAVTVNTVPDAPETAPLNFCGSAVASELTATTGTGLQWYTTETGGTALTGTEAITSGDYYVSQTVGVCESPRAMVTVTVNPIPAAPSIAQPAQTLCGGATVADLLPTDASIKWYTAPSTGTALAPDTVLAPGLSIYYASQTVDGCESTSRTPVAVQVNATAVPVANGNYTFCNVATVADLDAAGNSIKWYDSETATDELEDTVQLTTATYYVTQTLNGCESAKLPVAITVNEVTAPTASPLTLCGASTVEDLTAGGTGLKWYISNTAMDMLDNSAVITTGTYYVSQTVGTCETPRTPVAVTVNITDAITAGPFSFCNEATVNDLIATGSSVKWYASLTATDELEETVALATGTYYVTQTIDECESVRTAVSITVTNPVAVGDAVQQYTTGETLADLDVTGPGIVWYADEELTQMLPETTVLTEWTVYYAVPNEGSCTGEALAVQVDDILGNEGFNAATLKYYPNPVKDVLNVSYSEAITGVEVYNMLGQLVINKAPNSATLMLDMASLQAGTYMVKLQAGNATQTIKLIKQ